MIFIRAMTDFIRCRIAQPKLSANAVEQVPEFYRKKLNRVSWWGELRELAGEHVRVRHTLPFPGH